MTTTTCPICGKNMVERSNKRTGEKFYGCSGFPKCRGTRLFNEVNTSSPIVAKPKFNISTIKGTEQQEAIWSAIKSTTKHLIIEAVAGSGKTFTIKVGSQLIGDAVAAFFAFNNHIATELREVLPEGVTVSTLHSFAFTQVKKAFGFVKMDEYKLDGIIDTVMPIGLSNEAVLILKGGLTKLVNLVKYNLLDGKDKFELENLIYRHNIELGDMQDVAFGLVPRILTISKKQTKVVDFTDMIWFVYAHNLPVATFDIVMVDEAQDLNRLQRYVAKKALGANGRMIAVGDRKQAIYGFAGADARSIPNLIEELNLTDRGVEVYPLTFSRRIPRSHAEFAARIVPNLQSMPEAIEGSIVSMPETDALLEMQKGDIAIARRTAVVIKTAYALIRKDVPVVVKGRDIGKNIQGLINKLNAKSIDQLIEKAEIFRTKEIKKLEKRGRKAETMIVMLNDRVDTVIALTEGMLSIDAVMRRIDTLFTDADPSNVVRLMTVHKAKGLEVNSPENTLYILDYKRIRIPMSQDWAQEQEENLEYVALTRGKGRMVLVID